MKKGIINAETGQLAKEEREVTKWDLDLERV